MLCHPVPSAILPIAKVPTVYTTIFPQNFATEVTFTAPGGFPILFYNGITSDKPDSKKDSLEEIIERLNNLKFDNPYGPIRPPSPVSPARTPDNYICHICHVPGHTIKQCPDARPKRESFTPYQGPKRCFGEFRCNRCKRTWMSGNSWANSYQQCKKCRQPVYPFRQKSLENPEGLDRSDQSRIHPQHLCDKCSALGYYCRLHRPPLVPSYKQF